MAFSDFKKISDVSEAARCETIIFPALREIYQYYVENYALWIQPGIFYDAL